MAARTFTAADQGAFAALSGDVNPMHMDPDAARRTQAGACAVHGIAAMLWGLETLATDVDLGTVASLKADFQGFIPVDAPVTLAVTDRAHDRLRAEIRRDGARATTLDLGLDPAPRAAGFAEAPAPFRHAPLIGADPVPPVALDRRLEDIAGASGTLGPTPGTEERAAALYPQLSAALGPSTVALLALTSTLIGMVAPGLHSIFSGLTIALSGRASGPPALTWRVTRADARFRLATIEVAGPGLSGTLRAFIRFPPVAPPTWAAAAARVPAGAFAGRHALVIGGSRGLGAASALILAAGGAEVSLTYRSGRGEADDIAARIAAGRTVRTLPYDATAPATPQLATLEGVTDLFYFATGPIPAGAGGHFHRARLDTMLAVYADGFADAVGALLRAAPGRPLRAFYPSTIYVESRPAGLTEYAMAKAAGEILAADLARAHRTLTVTVHRLPRSLTDQTATVPPVPAADPLDVMAGVLLGTAHAAEATNQPT